MHFSDSKVASGFKIRWLGGLALPSASNRPSQSRRDKQYQICQ